MKRACRAAFPLLLFAILWIAWAAWSCWLLPRLPATTGTELLHSVVVKALLWVAPPLLLWRRSREMRFLPLSRLFAEPFPWLAALVLLCLSTAFLYTVRLLNGLQNTFVIFEPMMIILSVSAGVIEELSFRGGFFNLQEPALGFWPAALINGAMFVLLHYPELLFGGSWMQLISLRALLIFVMGVIFCWTFHQWKNLALNMTIHSAWNILSYLFCLA